MFGQDGRNRDGWPRNQNEGSQDQVQEQIQGSIIVKKNSLTYKICFKIIAFRLLLTRVNCDMTG